MAWCSTSLFNASNELKLQGDVSSMMDEGGWGGDEMGGGGGKDR